LEGLEGEPAKNFRQMGEPFMSKGTGEVMKSRVANQSVVTSWGGGDLPKHSTTKKPSGNQKNPSKSTESVSYMTDNI